MKEIILHGISILYSEYKYAESPELKRFLESKELSNYVKKIPKDTLVVLGGDGSMLEAVRENYKTKKSFLGINFGTKGFLLNTQESMKGLAKFEKRKYELLECSVGNKKTVALNEFDIKAGEGKMLDMKICVQESYELHIMGDGLIISSATGSTGYNSALGGAILPKSLNAYIITPKAPWKPKGQAPIILSNTQKISIFTGGRKTPIEVYADGKLFFQANQDSPVLKIQQSKHTVTFLVHKKYIDSWDNRVLEEQGFIKN